MVMENGKKMPQYILFSDIQDPSSMRNVISYLLLARHDEPSHFRF